MSPASSRGRALGAGSGDQPIRVLIADPDGLARRMIQDALQHADGILALPAARDGREALQYTRYYRPDVLILDTSLSADGCLELIGAIPTTAPGTRIVTASAEQDHAALAALRAGAIGHISKEIDPANSRTWSPSPPTARRSSPAG